VHFHLKFTRLPHESPAGWRLFGDVMKRKLSRLTGVVILAVTLVFVVYPFVSTSWHLISDLGLRSAAPSEFAFRLHRSLSRRLPGYIERRIASGKAEELSVAQITATEWPVYGAFFYLIATDRLQQQWENDRSLAGKPPVEAGAEAIEACARIITDPGHAHWVRKYWGDDYLDDPNCFYRMLVIGSLASHHRLTGKDEHLSLLERLVEDLVADIDASPCGLIDDYPAQCFPADVTVAIAVVLQADEALGTDRREWGASAFQRMLANFDGQLPPYMADAPTGCATAMSRGCTNGFFFSFAREIDAEAADLLYQDYVREFWQESGLAAGWREFPKDSGHPEDYFDSDSGVVFGGFGTAATGLGHGAARLHGDHRRAGLLGAEMIASGWPLPDGSLLIPRLVSDREHAPHFAECVILHQMALASGEGSGERAGIPGCVWLILGFEALVGALLLGISGRLLRCRAKRAGKKVDAACGGPG